MLCSPVVQKKIIPNNLHVVHCEQVDGVVEGEERGGGTVVSPLGCRLDL